MFNYIYNVNEENKARPEVLQQYFKVLFPLWFMNHKTLKSSRVLLLVSPLFPRETTGAPRKGYISCQRQGLPRHSDEDLIGTWALIPSLINDTAVPILQSHRNCTQPWLAGLFFLRRTLYSRARCELKCNISIMPHNILFQAKSYFPIDRVVWGTAGHPSNSCFPVMTFLVYGCRFIWQVGRCVHWSEVHDSSF